MTLDEFQALPMIAAAFPLVFTNGARWTAIDGKCHECSSPMPHAVLRGVVTHPLPRVYAIEGRLGRQVEEDREGLGYCARCHLLTRFEYRLYDDMSLTGKADGQWHRWVATSATTRLLDRLLRWLGWRR